jgi:hypothetical protein
MVVRVAQTHHVAVVARALVGVGEGRVGLADAHEAGGRGGVGRVVVWVVAFAEEVEGSVIPRGMVRLKLMEES